MLNKFLTLTLVFFSNIVFGQTYYNPKCISQTTVNLKITKINCADNSTTIEFEYITTDSKSIYIFLNPPNTDGALYIKADGKTYKLLSTSGIGNTDRITPAYTNKPVNFSATFDAIPKTIKQFDLIEGISGSWNFHGIQLKESSQIENCDDIKFTPGTPKPDFSSFLAGVRYALIIGKPEINGHIPAFNALYGYLKDLGFESIRYDGDENYVPPQNLCEEVGVAMGFKYEPAVAYYDISVSFYSPCNGYTWDFQTNKKASDGQYANPQYNFSMALRDIYGYKKADFNKYYRLEPPSRKTCWTESKYKNYVQSNGCDEIEGIYESTNAKINQAQYRFIVRKINGTYYLIYLSGATNSDNWTEGEIKATLESTATPYLFRAKWLMMYKEENNDYYLTFKNGSLIVISNNQEEELYLKYFPSATDKINIPSDVATSGTGFAISSNGYIVTNNHVTDGAKTIKVRGVNGDFSKAYNAKISIEDKKNDLSIIKIDDPSFTSLGVVPYVFSGKSCEVGSSVFCLGYPLRSSMGDEVKLTNGIISSKTGYQGDITTYQITAPVQPGNSGGPLFNDNGNLVGIINAKHMGAENASYAIKSSYLLNLIDIMTAPPKLQSVSLVTGKSLSEQVKIVKKYTYIIEVN
jgi:S1-C subfamily serine protease